MTTTSPRRRAREIMDEAVSRFSPIRIFAGFSGGNDSLAVAHWVMTHCPGAELFHIDTGIGIKKTQEFAIETAKRFNWPLVIIRAKEDCGQDYDAIVRQFGFPGPPGHQLMYRRLKDRAVERLVRQVKTGWHDKILIATGVRAAESVRRMGYGTRVINQRGAQVWVNPIYWWSDAERDAYLATYQIPRNPVSAVLGISGECLCGAFAHPGELERVRSVDPEVAQRIDSLAAEVAERFPWGWEGRPPTKRKNPAMGPLCGGCEKSAVVQAEIADSEV